MYDLISVILPVYNVEEWISKSIRSIKQQTYSHFELIIVNDGSKDKSVEICEEYAKFDNRIKIIHKKNGGLSSARNAGIENARGKYIVFIDSDDIVHKNYLKKLYQSIEDNQCDAIVSGYMTVPTNDTKIPGYKLNTKLNGKDFILSAPNIHTNNDLCFVWRYIYKLNLIKERNIRFNEKVFIGEDVIFNLEYLLSASKVCAIPDVLYFYTVDNQNSLMRTKYKPTLESSLKLQYDIRKKLSVQYNLFTYEHYKKDMANYYVHNIYFLLLNNLKNKKTKSTELDIRRITNYEMMIDNFKEIGFMYRCQNLKEYLFFLVSKLKLYPLVFTIFSRKEGD